MKNSTDQSEPQTTHYAPTAEEAKQNGTEENVSSKKLKGAVEKTGNMFEHYLEPDVLYVVTTNGYIKNDGSLVMGRGVAKYAANLHPDLPHILGDLVATHGNIPFLLPYNFVSLPVKHHWREKADINLIVDSLRFLTDLLIVYGQPGVSLYMPRPGCGNGGLEWPFVKEQIRPYISELWVETGMVTTIWNYG